MKRPVRHFRAGFALPVTIIIAGVCALLITVAYKAVNDGARTVQTYLDQSCCRLAAQTAMDVFVEKLHAAFNAAAWEDDQGNESPVHMNEVNTIYGKFFSSGGMNRSLATVVADFNVHEAAQLGGSATNLNGWVARLGPQGNGGDGDRSLDIAIALETPDAVNDVTVATDDAGFYQYAEVTLRMRATARRPRGGTVKECGATSLVEERIRFGALGFGRRAGVYANDRYALPARCFESAINADCPLVFATCAGNSGWTINGEVRTRGFVYCGNAGDFQTLESGDGRVTRVHGEIHVATNAPGLYSPPFENGSVNGTANFSCFTVSDGKMLEECVNGDNCTLRFPSPGRRRGYPVPESGSLAWYGYEGSRLDVGSSVSAANGVFKGGYGCWQAIEEAGGQPVCRMGADAEWFHIPILANMKKGAWATGGTIQLSGSRSKDINAVLLGCYPGSTILGRKPVSFTLTSQRQFKPSTTTTEPLVLIGSYRYPIVVKGPFYWNGDVIIGGFVQGHGIICAGRNVHIVRDIIMKDPPTWRQDQDYDDAAKSVNANADMVTLMARGNIVIGNYLDTSRNASDNVATFRDKIQLAGSYDAQGGVRSPSPSTLQLQGYRWRPYVTLPEGSPLGTGTFDGDYFSKRDLYGRPLFEPYMPDDGYGNCVTNLCRPVLRIDAMLCSVNAIVGVVGPGDFAAAQWNLETSVTLTDAVGYGKVNGGIGLRAGHGMQLRNGGARKNVEDYLMTPGTVFTLNGGLVCRDLALYLDYDQSVTLGDGKRWTPDRVKAIVNWDDRYMADSEDANYLTRSVRDRISDLRDHPAQNPLELPTDASPKPQVLSWREISDGVTEVNWQ